MENLIVLLIIFFICISLAFIGFVVYFIFKSLQFVIKAINLYKDMVQRQDALLKAVIDIRDNIQHNEPKKYIEEKETLTENSNNEKINSENEEQIQSTQDMPIQNDYNKKIKHKVDDKIKCKNCGKWHSKEKIGQLCSCGLKIK